MTIWAGFPHVLPPNFLGPLLLLTTGPPKGKRTQGSQVPIFAADFTEWAGNGCLATSSCESTRGNEVPSENYLVGGGRGREFLDSRAFSSSSSFENKSPLFRISHAWQFCRAKKPESVALRAYEFGGLEQAWLLAGPRRITYRTREKNETESFGVKWFGWLQGLALPLVLPAGLSQPSKSRQDRSHGATVARKEGQAPNLTYSGPARPARPVRWLIYPRAIQILLRA